MIKVNEISIMNSFSNVYFGIHFWFLIFLHITHTQQSCPAPNVPQNGNYFPRKDIYLPEDEIRYQCNDDYLERGASNAGQGPMKCRGDGYWSHQMPFCDAEAEVRKLSSFDDQGNEQPLPQVDIDTPSACYRLQAGHSLRVRLEKPSTLFVVGMYFILGNINIEITNGSDVCSSYNARLSNHKWEFIRCRQRNLLASYVSIQDISTQDSSTICNIKVYTTGEGCNTPPRERMVPNGYFEVSRSLARLICINGYEIGGNNDRLVCDKGAWVGSGLQCNELPKTSVVATTATSVGILAEGSTTNTVVLAVTGVVVVLILISLFGIIIHCVRKLRREVVEVQNQPVNHGEMSFPRPESECPDYAYPTYEAVKYEAMKYDTAYMGMGNN